LRSIRFTYDIDIFGGDDPDSDDDDWWKKESTLEPVHFANNFFKHLDANRSCLNLNALIIGRPVDMGGATWSIPEQEHQLEFKHVHPWHCFIKSYQTKRTRKDGAKEKAAVAVPVPAHVLQSHRPEYNMPDMIPRAHWIDSSVGESWGFSADRRI
jgi:hypothetical protein